MTTSNLQAYISLENKLTEKISIGWKNYLTNWFFFSTAIVVEAHEFPLNVYTYYFNSKT